jgi:uncharacterized protein YajQ (UPF0234 family)
MLRAGGLPMPSFDVVSKVQMHEVDNAIQQTAKEIGTRYDFRDTGTSIERTEEGIVLRANSEGRIEAALQVMQEKFVRRKVSLKALDPQKIEPAGGSTYRQLIKLSQGIATDKAKEIVKFLKAGSIKVQAAIQADQVRVSGSKKDTLQQAIAALRNEDFGVDLQFENYRD